MKKMGSLTAIKEAIDRCRAECQNQNTPFHADALAATLGITYETLVAYAEGKGSVGVLLKGALQECTASVISYALNADPKSHSMWMFYLRNRAGFSEKGERPENIAGGGVQFVGEERIP